MEVPNPANPRKHFDQTALEELAESIKQVGILEPLVVVWVEKPTPEGENMKFRKFCLVAGESGGCGYTTRSEGDSVNNTPKNRGGDWLENCWN